MVECGIYFAETDTILVFTIFYKLFGGGTCLAMPKAICEPDIILVFTIIEAWFRGY